jgi:hypothetical protein
VTSDRTVTIGSSQEGAWGTASRTAAYTPISGATDNRAERSDPLANTSGIQT